MFRGLATYKPVTYKKSIETSKKQSWGFAFLDGDKRLLYNYRQPKMMKTQK